MVSLSLLYGCKTRPNTELNLKETELAVISEGYKIATLFFSPNGRRYAYRSRRDGKWFVFSDEKQEGPYDMVQEVVFSPDSESLAYVARREGKMYDDVGEPVFSPGSTLVAYEAAKGDKWHIALNSRESNGCDLLYGPPVFSADDRYLTFIEQHFDKKRGFRVVSDAALDNVEKGREYDGIGLFVLSSDRSHIAYAASRDGKHFVVTGDFERPENENEGAKYDAVDKLAISPDGKKSAYLAERDGQRYLILDTIEEKFSADDLLFPPVFSADSSRIVVVGTREREVFVMVDGEEGDTYDSIGPPVFSSDGSRLVYPAKKNDKWFIVIDGKAGNSRYDFVVSPLFNHDDSRIIYRVRDKKGRFVVVADSEGNVLHEHPSYEAVWQPVLSSDGSRIAYGVKEKRKIWWKVETLP
jgi:Tol biopolymer transport system component